MKAFGITNQGLVRANNEDAYFIDEAKGLLIVADGMGGHAGGEEASRLAVETAIAAMKDNYLRRPEQTVKLAFKEANRAVLEKSISDPTLSGMGTTLTMVLALPDFLITGHIGDSKAFLIGNEGKSLTSDHSVSGQLLASGRITSAEAVNHPQRHVLTRALGTEKDVEAEVLRYPWSRGQYILVCSDGLTEVMSEPEIYPVVSGPGSLETKAKSLLATVLDRGAPDNVTMVLAQL